MGLCSLVAMIGIACINGSRNHLPAPTSTLWLLMSPLNAIASIEPVGLGYELTASLPFEISSWVISSTLFFHPSPIVL
jgi:hypothetical protein